eukprot:133020-Chlamydomonas_euryale.AAC.1
MKGWMRSWLEGGQMDGDGWMGGWMEDGRWLHGRLDESPGAQGWEASARIYLGCRIVADLHRNRHGCLSSLGLWCGPGWLGAWCGPG